mmetsp:Transcript_8574/g.12636  ORF Transcript_8574/g.12636 Transcript_8574/m.12636 type:complete len:416 (+) Transcript_8574:60-1307(+)
MQSLTTILAESKDETNRVHQKKKQTRWLKRVEKEKEKMEKDRLYMKAMFRQRKRKKLKAWKEASTDPEMIEKRLIERHVPTRTFRTSSLQQLKDSKPFEHKKYAFDSFRKYKFGTKRAVFGQFIRKKKDPTAYTHTTMMAPKKDEENEEIPLLSKKKPQRPLRDDVSDKLYDFSDARRSIRGISFKHALGRDNHIQQQDALRKKQKAERTIRLSKRKPKRTLPNYMLGTLSQNQPLLDETYLPSFSRTVPNVHRIDALTKKRHEKLIAVDMSRSTGREIVHCWMKQAGITPKSSLSYDIKDDYKIKGAIDMGHMAGRAETSKALFKVGEKQITDLFYFPSFKLMDKNNASAYIFFGETGRQEIGDSGAKGKCRTSDILLARVEKELNGLKKLDKEIYKQNNYKPSGDIYHYRIDK